jgi:hypothetical protein
MDAVEQRRDKLVLRLGAHVQLDELPTLPERYRQQATQFEGRLGSVLLRPDAAEAWCRLSGGLGGQVWPPAIKRVDTRTIPLNDHQSPTPHDFIELHPKMPVNCTDGEGIGKLEGIVIATATGLADALLIRIRGNMEDVVASPRDPLAVLVPEQDQALMVPPEWASLTEAVSTKTRPLGVPRSLQLNANAVQVAHGLQLRDDAALQQDVYTILGKSWALAPYMSELRVSVHDGIVSINGTTLSPRLRASLEQDIWHIPGVLAVRSRLG